MSSCRKLGRPFDQRKAMLIGLVTALIQHGKVKTTEKRAKEVKRIADWLISLAVKEVDNFTTGEVKVSMVKKDEKGKKLTKTVTSKNGNQYDVVERELTTKEVRIDKPSRLHARREIINWLYRVRDNKGNVVNLVDKLLNEIASARKESIGGHTRIFKLGPRRGDGAESAVIEIIS